MGWFVALLSILDIIINNELEIDWIFKLKTSSIIPAIQYIKFSINQSWSGIRIKLVMHAHYPYVTHSMQQRQHETIGIWSAQFKFHACMYVGTHITSKTVVCTHCC